MMLRELLGMVAVALAVRLMDDYLDRQHDAEAGAPNTVSWLGDAAPVYALAALAVASSLAPRVAGALFLAAYAVGMLGDTERALPLGLAPWQESLAAVLIAFWATGPQLTVASLLALVAVQLVDDWLDGARVARFGLRPLDGVETVLLAVASLLVAAVAAPVVALATAVIGLAWAWLRRPASWRSRP